MKILLPVLFVLMGGLCFAQEAQMAEPFFEEVEAVTARSMGTAGSFGAVGADLSSATQNPAGIAFFRKKELGLSLGHNRQMNDVQFLNGQTETDNSALRLSNAGFVYSNLQTEWIGDSLAVKSTGIVNWALTIGMNQKSELKEITNYSRFNQNSSLISSYVSSANQYAAGGLSLLDEYEQQAVDVDLINFTENEGIYNYNSEISGGQVLQQGNQIREGAKRDFYLGGGINYSNKLYVGATIGVPWYTFENNLTYTEEDSQANYDDFQELELKDTRSYDGIGGYLGVGAVYRFSDYFRAGLNLRSPTVIEVNESSTILTRNSEVQSRSDFKSTYNLTLPWKAGLQLVASHPQYGLISLEGDFVDYSSTKLNYLDEMGDFTQEETQFEEGIDRYYKGTFNVRGGIEARLVRDLRLRAGYAYYDSPYENKEDEFGADYAKKVLGLGLGYRFVPLNITLDLGYNRIASGEWDSAYLLNNNPNEIVTDQVSNQIRLSISKRFNR